MAVIAALFIGLLTAVLGAFTAGYVGVRAVDWYHIPSREGGSGYFVVTIGLLGIVVGFITGLICGLSFGADTPGGFFKALGIALAIVLYLSATGFVITRLYADVPPKQHGEKLFLVVEVKWPPTRTDSPALEPGEAYVSLGSLKGHTLRKSERGQLWKHDAAFVDGQWIVRGAVDIFTSRGKRVLEINLGDSSSVGFLIPLPAFPRSAQETWSDWMPRRFPATTPIEQQVTCRFRVQRTSEAMHVESFGSFQITTFTHHFHESWEEGQRRVVSSDHFAITARGVAVNNVRYLIKLPDTTSALLAIVDGADGSHALSLLHDRNGTLQIDNVLDASAGYPTFIPLTPVDTVEPPSLSENRRQLLVDGLYFVGVNTIFDTRILKTHHYTSTQNTELGDFHPLMVSPDERSFARFTFAPDTQAHQITVTDFVGDRSYSLPIDRQHMRYVKIDQINRAWAEHHFRWERDASEIEQLVARTDFSPVPYRGELGPSGHTGRTFYLYGSTELIGPVLENVLIEKFAAQRQPPVEYQVDQRFLIDGVEARVFASSNIASVSVGNTTLMEQIADALNAELATYKHDVLFSFQS